MTCAPPPPPDEAPSAPAPGAAPGSADADARPALETERLTLRAFTPADAGDLLALALDKESQPTAKYDLPWPTDAESCRALAAAFSGNASFWAVAMKPGGRVVGLATLTPAGPGEWEVGHVFHSALAGAGYDTEALRAVFAYAVGTLGAMRLVAHVAADWTEAWTPLVGLGMTPEADFEVSLRPDASGAAQPFVGVRLAVDRAALRNNKQF